MTADGTQRGTSGATRRLTPGNLLAALLIALLLAGSVAAALLVARPADESALRAVVHDGDGGEHALPLAEEGELVVSTSYGTNIVAVEDGRVFVREADCANHDCMRQGAIDTPGQQLVCLPHRLWVEIVAEGGETGSMDTSAVPGDSAETDGYDAVAR